MRIVYMGTPAFAASILADMIADITEKNNLTELVTNKDVNREEKEGSAPREQNSEKHEIIAVYTQPDRQAGRGKKLHEPETKTLAKAHNIPVYQPETFRSKSAVNDNANNNNADTAYTANQAVEELRALQPDILIVAAYGMLLPQVVLDIPRLGAYNVHASLLPKYRGAAPVQRALIAGDKVTGVTIMRMEAGLDTGPILLQQCVPIRNSLSFCDNTQSLLDSLAKDGAKLMLIALNMIAQNRATFVAQNDALATHAPKLTKQEAQINWALSAEKIHNHIRGFSPNPGASTSLCMDGKEPIQARIEAGFYLNEKTFTEEEFQVFSNHIAKIEDEFFQTNTNTSVDSLNKSDRVSAEKFLQNGQIIGIFKDYLLVKTAKDYYGITQIRLAGKAPMNAKAFMNGYFKNNTPLYFATTK